MTQTNNHELIEDFHEFYNRYYDNRDGDNPSAILELAQNYPNEQRSLYIDYDDLYQYPELAPEDWIQQPELMQEYAEEALRLYDIPVDIELADAHVRLTNLPESLTTYPNWYSPSEVENELRGIEGQVTKISEKRAEDQHITWECQRCGTVTDVPQDGESIQKPHECQGCERQGPFQALPSNDNASNTVSVDHRLIRVQTPPEVGNGNTKTELDINIRDDLVDELETGDRVTVNTIIRTRHEGSESDPSRRKENYGDAVSIEVKDTDFEDLEITKEDEQRIKEIAASNPHQKIVDSIKPSHKGDEEIKETLALQMFGGVEKPLPDGSKIRGDFHVGLIGDPGTDKSGLLSYVKDLSPRSVYTSGKQSSNAGLTCAAVQDDFGGGGWTIEGGAVVQANKGILCVDEFDKTDEEDQSGLMEALSKQTVSPAKAGISNVELPAKTSMLAAMNPSQGRFDPYQAFGEQIDLRPELLSRFDLLFTMTDQPDEEEDRELAGHLLEASRVGQQRAAGVEDAGRESEYEPEIEADLMQKYIAYAKQNCHPVMTEDAIEAIKDFYVDIRQANDDDGPVPVTARKIEALVRLAEASARVRLSDEATVEDAHRVIAIVQSCLSDVGIDPETGQFDTDIVETGKSRSQHDRYDTVLRIIEVAEDESESRMGAPVDEVIERAGEKGLDHDQTEHAIDHWKSKGEIYEVQSDYLKTT